VQAKTEAQLLNQRILQDGRAMDDFGMAGAYLQTALAQGEGCSPTVLSALYQAAVISYARPFAQVRGGTVYPVRGLKAGPFDNEVHEHFLKLRHRFLAHSDTEAFTPRLQIQVYRYDTDDGRTGSTPVGLLTCIYGWDGIEDLGYVERAGHHVDGIVKTLSRELADRQGRLLNLLQADPQSIVQSEPEVVGQYRMKANASHLMPLAEFQRAAFKAPDVEIGGPDYRYHQTGLHTLADEIMVVLSDGDEVRLTLAVESSRSASADEPSPNSAEGIAQSPRGIRNKSPR
jgi:hypothetical protein